MTNLSAPFPQPHKLGPNCTRWLLSEILAYEATCAGAEPPALSPAEDSYLTVKQVADRHGIGVNTVWRWAREAGQ